MEWKRTKLHSILTLTCPHCHQGPFFMSHPYDLSRAGDIHDRCTRCGRNLSIEPGFYYGAMYVAYGLGVAICLLSFLGLRLCFPRLPLYWIIAVLAGVMIFGGPYFYALSKIIWANLFIRAKDPEAAP